MNSVPLLFTSLGSMLFMNILAILVGNMIPLLLVRDIVDWIGFFCFLGFGILNLYDGCTKESRTVIEEYNEEIEENDNQYNQLIEGENDIIRNDQSGQFKSLSKLCGELFVSLLLSELGDKSEIATITIAAIYNVYGVLIGTTAAYLLTILIAAFIGKVVGQYITEKSMCIIGGVLFLGFAF